MNEDQRKTVVTNVTLRILRNLDKTEGYTRQELVRTLVNMLDDLHLEALQFAFEMTPEPKENKEK